MKRIGWFIACLIVLSAPACAQRGFEQYEGGDSIKQGEGGTKIVRDGVDFWTTGSPPKKYQILGVIKDKRLDGPLITKAVGSAGIARKVRAAGGDAVIVASASSKIVDSQLSARTSTDLGGDEQTTVRRDDTRVALTSFIVIKYLDQ